jgi:hypothetical protein
VPETEFFIPLAPSKPVKLVPLDPGANASQRCGPPQAIQGQLAVAWFEAATKVESAASARQKRGGIFPRRVGYAGKSQSNGGRVSGNTKIGEKGQVTIPKQFREGLDLGALPPGILSGLFIRKEDQDNFAGQIRRTI